MRILGAALLVSLVANALLLHRLDGEDQRREDACVNARYARTQEVLLWAGAGRCFDRFTVSSQILNSSDQDMADTAKRLRLRDAVQCAELFVQFGNEYPDSEYLADEREVAKITGNTRGITLVKFIHENASNPEHRDIANQLAKMKL